MRWRDGRVGNSLQMLHHLKFFLIIIIIIIITITLGIGVMEKKITTVSLHENQSSVEVSRLDPAGQRTPTALIFSKRKKILALFFP